MAPPLLADSARDSRDSPVATRRMDQPLLIFQLIHRIIRDSRDSRMAHEFLLAYSVSADFRVAANKKANGAAGRGSWWKS